MPMRALLIAALLLCYGCRSSSVDELPAIETGRSTTWRS